MATAPEDLTDAKVDAVIAYFRKTRGDFTAEKQAAKREGRKAKLAQSVTNKMSLGDLVTMTLLHKHPHFGLGPSYAKGYEESGDYMHNCPRCGDEWTHHDEDAECPSCPEPGYEEPEAFFIPVR